MNENMDSVRDRRVNRWIAISREARAWVVTLVTAAGTVAAAAFDVMLR